MKSLAALLVLCAAHDAWAVCDSTVPAQLTVNTFTDNATCAATCSLRGAILRANVACAPVQISVPAGTYAVTGALVISATQTLIGEGAAQTVIDAGKSDRVLSVQSALTLSGVTLSHGKVTGRGGGLFVSAGAVTASDVIFANNQASAQGGGVAIEVGASLSCSDCVATGNVAHGGGGAVVGGTLSWSDGELLDNTSSSDGGGIRGEAGGGGITLLRSLVSGNTATFGGGISGSLALTLQDSTLANNTANAGDGGGIAQGADNANLRNVTVSGNTASGAGGGVSMAQQSSSVWLDVTVSGNHADSGGGISIAGTGMSLSGVLATGNTATTDADCVAIAMPSGGHNLIQPSTGCLIAAVGSDVSGDSKLLPLADNGGAVPTHALGSGSAAIDAGPLGLSADARGVTRPQGAAPDIGAFERGAAVLSLAATSTPATAAAGSAVLHTYRVTNLGPTPAVQVTATGSGAILAASAAPGTCVGSVCAVGSIAPGTSANVTLLVAGALSSSLTVSADNATAATLELATTATASADLVLSAIPDSGHIDLGSQTVVRFTVLNRGPSDVQAATLSVSAGSETFLVPEPAAPVTCTIANGAVSCALGAIAAGATQSVSLEMSASALGELSFHATATSEVADPDASNSVLDQNIAVSGVNAASTAPTSSASGVSTAASTASKKGCASVASAWWMVSLVVWWRRPRRSWSRR